MLKDKKAVIFDFDGTLVDSMWMWEQIDIEYLTARGIEYPKDYQHCIEGMAFREVADYSIKRFGLTETPEELMNVWNSMAYEMYCHRVPYKPGALEFLKYLKAKGIKTGIATSNSTELLNAALDALDMRQYIDEIHTSSEVEHGKPAPDIYLLVAEKLGVAPKDCLVFEDVPTGIRGGKNAGMTVCGVADDFSKDVADKKKELADYYIESFEELL